MRCLDLAERMLPLRFLLGANPPVCQVDEAEKKNRVASSEAETFGPLAGGAFRVWAGLLLVLLVWQEASSASAQPQDPNVPAPNVPAPNVQEPNAQENAKSKSSVATEDSTLENKAKETPADGWKSLLPAKGLDGWEITDFGTKGKVDREGDSLIIQMGDPLNGVTYSKKDFPTDDYEIYLEAKRIEGRDFLCGLTFPVGKEFCSLIAGGWGGGLVGLSSVDGSDASENATTTYYEFENGMWYKFKVRVDQEFVRVWIDDKEFVRQERDGHEFSTRIEVYVSQPLGYSTFQSKVEIKDFKWRPINGDKKKSP